MFTQVLGLEDQLQRQRSRAALLRDRLKAQQPPQGTKEAVPDLPGPTAPMALSVSPGTYHRRLIG